MDALLHLLGAIARYGAYHNLNMSIGYGAYHNLDGLLGIYAYITHLGTYKHGKLMDDHTLSLNPWM